MMMMGYAYQKGLLPLSAKAIEQAIEVNGVAIKMNTQAFQLGRLAAADPARLAAMMKDQDETVAPKTLDAMSLDEIIAHRSALLTDYQNAKLAERYRNLVTQVRDAATEGGYGDALAARGRDQLRQTARLQGRVRGRAALHRRPVRKAAPRPVRGRLQVQLQPRAADPGGGVDALGRPKKRAFGAWMMPVFRMLAKMRGLRGTPFDIFGYSADRKLERDLIAGYEKDVATVLGLLSPVTHRYRGRDPVAARPHPRLRPGEGEGGAGRQSALRATRRRPRQPAARAAADRGGVGAVSQPSSRYSFLRHSGARPWREPGIH